MSRTCASGVSYYLVVLVQKRVNPAFFVLFNSSKLNLEFSSNQAAVAAMQGVPGYAPQGPQGYTPLPQGPQPQGFAPPPYPGLSAPGMFKLRVEELCNMKKAQNHQPANNRFYLQPFHLYPMIKSFFQHSSMPVKLHM